MASPHTTPSLAVAVENDRREYVCFAGMWWTPENHLAYMEPLCTVPQYRRKGLAAAVHISTSADWRVDFLSSEAKSRSNPGGL
ncbi:MAG: GNAT family N-acetyltransferase [Oscillospiraceae bacterium]|nr:GNAT family N-acetyltransferase [Oscillospiraceae bacterium]